MAEDTVVHDLPDGPLQISIFGRKGQGKSELAWLLWESWPGDRVLIDTTGDVGRLHPDPETVDLPVPPPSRWPAELQEADWDRLSLRYVPDHGEPFFREDMDRVVGLAFSHHHTLLWVEEEGLIAEAGRVMPNMRRALHMGRHQELWKIGTMPRPMGVDPLVLANADAWYCFDCPNPDDRKRLADACGIPRGEMDEALGSLEDHGYVRYIAKHHELAVFPALPPPRRQTVAQAHLDGPADLDE